MKRLKYSFCATAQLAPVPPNATTPPYRAGFFIVLISNHQCPEGITPHRVASWLLSTGLRAKQNKIS
jgi:hypothetical protein